MFSFRRDLDVSAARVTDTLARRRRFIRLRRLAVSLCFMGIAISLCLLRVPEPQTSLPVPRVDIEQGTRLLSSHLTSRHMPRSMTSGFYTHLSSSDRCFTRLPLRKGVPIPLTACSHIPPLQSGQTLLRLPTYLVPGAIERGSYALVLLDTPSKSSLQSSNPSSARSSKKSSGKGKSKKQKSSKKGSTKNQSPEEQLELQKRKQKLKDKQKRLKRSDMPRSRSQPKGNGVPRGGNPPGPYRCIHHLIHRIQMPPLMILRARTLPTQALTRIPRRLPPRVPGSRLSRRPPAQKRNPPRTRAPARTHTRALMRRRLCASSSGILMRRTAR